MTSVVSVVLMRVNKNPDTKQHDSYIKYKVSALINITNKPQELKLLKSILLLSCQWKCHSRNTTRRFTKMEIRQVNLAAKRQTSDATHRHVSSL
jgi:hypothetical protein